MVPTFRNMINLINRSNMKLFSDMSNCSHVFSCESLLALARPSLGREDPGARDPPHAFLGEDIIVETFFFCKQKLTSKSLASNIHLAFDIKTWQFYFGSGVSRFLMLLYHRNYYCTIFWLKTRLIFSHFSLRKTA